MQNRSSGSAKTNVMLKFYKNKLYYDKMLKPYIKVAWTNNEQYVLHLLILVNVHLNPLVLLTWRSKMTFFISIKQMYYILVL